MTKRHNDGEYSDFARVEQQNNGGVDKGVERSKKGISFKIGGSRRRRRIQRKPLPCETVKSGIRRMLFGCSVKEEWAMSVGVRSRD